MSAPTVHGLIAAQARAQKARLQLAAAAGATVSAAAVCLLGLSGWFIVGAAFAGLAGTAAAQAFNYMMPSAIIRLLAILRTGARYVERVAGHEAALNGLAKLRPQLFHALASAPVAKALGLSSGEASARLVQDVDAIQTLFVRRSVPWSLGAGAMAAVLLAALTSVATAAVLLMVMGLTCAGSVLIGLRLARPAGHRAQQTMGRLKDRLSSLEAVSPELRAYGLDAWAVSEVETVAAEHDQAILALSRAGGWMMAWQAASTALAAGLVLGISAGAPLPLVALAVLAAVMGVEAAGGLAGALQQTGAAEAAVTRLDQLLDDSPADTPAPARLLVGLAGIGTAQRPPSRIGIFGPSGSGKTTQIEQMIGLRETAAREGAAGCAERRAAFAYAAQDVRLMGGTVRDNLLLAGPADEAELWRALEDAALAERVRRDPAGLDMAIGPNGHRLSGGERRRLGLARAYLRDAPWLVLDEPTEGLDAETEARVLEALDRRLKDSGQGLILVSHREAPLALCDQRYGVGGTVHRAA